MDIFNYLSFNVKNTIINFIKIEEYQCIEEIRLRNNQRLQLKLNNMNKLLSYIVTSEDLIECLERISENSIYSYQNQICNGYITIKGGHRVGISGNVATEENKVININYINSLNFRIAKEITGCSDEVFEIVFNKKEEYIYNSLIVGRPGSGKTTLLRDLIRNISNYKEKFNVGVVDERSELSAMYRGEVQNDLGNKTDVLENVPKIIRNKNVNKKYGS